ncbi:Vmh family MBL fold metallo-hydrolase [Acinetobacter sp. MD2(2019)]|uniref:Vmh family MBL fold metallo-hydrolase n=1 Tax=Acinetobacter sp. MD2(2019) TaxID=2605273 RepID=UPI002D1E830C|nr:Vmh family MBL fold metallo-hydrolase [Acinetobacter sp. MD2(2019)]MEB3754878.1 MBL fold metallo-hydrolase [Acinetobacter sp. MD2(2019)]
MKKQILFTALSVLTTTAFAVPLSYQTYNPQEKGLFPVSSTLITGKHDAVLVDAQASVKDGEQLVNMIQKSGKQLKYIVITAGDPDYYFGLQPIVKAFPKAKIIATPKVVDHIEQTKAAKIAYWGPILKDGAPTELYVPKATTLKTLKLEDHSIQFKDTKSYAAYLWVPKDRVLLGGVGVSSGIYLWTADTQTKEARAEWSKTLTKMKKLHPKTVIPGHYLGEMPKGVAAIDFTHQYLADFENTLKTNTGSAAVIAVMKAKYPHLAEEGTLEFSAKVNTGEMKW